jgi:serine/threonine-protein kinase
MEDKRFNRDTEKFIKNMEKVLKNNCFENEIQDNSDLLKTVVEGHWKYYPRKEWMKFKDLEKFLKWFKDSTHDSQRLILDNVINKLSKKEILEEEIDLSDIPF